MNKLYSERNGLRDPITKTTIIDVDSYAILWDCCDRYKINLAWKYPDYCYDNPQVICGVNEDSLNTYLRKTIPDLICGHPAEKSHKVIEIENPFGSGDDELEEIEDERNFYSILDYVEFIACGMKTVKKGDLHPYWSHYHLTFVDDEKDFETFLAEINELFVTCGLLYQLTEEKKVERIVEDDFIIDGSKTLIDATPEKELKKLIEEAIALHKSRKPEDHHLATEKIWDAYERLRSYYIKEEKDKKASANRIISEMSKGDAAYEDLFTREFLELGNIGNDYRIRHSEIGKIDIPNDFYYDYFFSRCFAMIVLALKYIR